MTTPINENTIEDLITAFSYKLTMETSFYWKIATKRLVEVSILDYTLISDCKENYNSGLDPEDELEIKEAIIANEKKRNTHIVIPRLSIEERVELMNEFILTLKDSQQKENLQNTLNQLVDLTGANPIEFIKKGFKMGFDLDNLTVNLKELSQIWTDFYRTEINHKVANWLNTINAST